MDSSAMLNTQLDMVDFLRTMLPNSPHVLVIPEDVLIELKGLQNATAGSKAQQAESVLRALSVYPDFAARGGAVQGSSHTSTPTAAATKAASPATSSAASHQRGVAVLQRPKETFYPLKKFARNRDTNIVACAYYFAVNDNNNDSGGVGGEPAAQRQAPARRFIYESAFFVTNDVVQHIKASPYGIPTIDTATLKMRWGHLGHWEP